MANIRKKIGKHSVSVVSPENVDKVAMSSDDQDMDTRMKAAVNSAIHKAKVCQKPIAKYDSRKKKAYVLDSNGVKKYVS